MEIAQEHSGFRARDDQNEKYQKQKTEHVVHLARPNRVQNEEQLDKDAAEWQNAAHDDAGYGLSVDGLIGYLTGDLIGAYWMLQCLPKKVLLHG